MGGYTFGKRKLSFNIYKIDLRVLGWKLTILQALEVAQIGPQKWPGEWVELSAKYRDGTPFWCQTFVYPYRSIL